MEGMEKKRDGWEERTRRWNWRCFRWTASWVGTVALATFGPMFLWESLALTVAAIALNLLIGIGLIVMYTRWLKSLDELQQRIQLEALALAVGAGVVGGLSYSLLDQTNVIGQDAEISFVVVLMSLTYLCAMGWGNLRYK